MADPVPDPAEERGGEHPDWRRAKPGEELPDQEEAETAAADEDDHGHP